MWYHYLNSKFMTLCTLVCTHLLPALPAHSLTLEEKTVLQQIRNQIFGGSRLTAAIEQTTISGLEPPVFSYQVNDRVLLIWKIKPDKISEFSAMIGLQPPFTLAKSLPLAEKYKQARFIEWLSVWDENLSSYFSRFLPKQHFYVIADIGNTSGAEQGSKIEFKTFISVAGSKPYLYRFASYKAIPGNDLVEVSNNTPSNLTWTSDEIELYGALYAGDYQLQVSIPYRLNRRGVVKRFSDKQFSRAYLDAAQRVLAPNGAQSRYYYDGSSVSAEFNLIRQRVARYHLLISLERVCTSKTIGTDSEPRPWVT